MGSQDYLIIPLVVLAVVAGILKFKYMRSRSRQLNEPPGKFDHLPPKD